MRLSFTQPISPHLSPNALRKDIWFCFRSLCNPIRWLFWRSGDGIAQLRKKIGAMHNTDHVYTVDSGRTALHLVLRSLHLEAEDEVVLQAFTCTVVPTSIIAANAKPRYVDIDSTYNIDVEKLEILLKNSPRIRAVIVQHTFGIPANIARIQELCRQYTIFLIEDCAHALGAKYKHKYVGTYGDAAIFSFGRDKVISTVSGGALIIHNEQIVSAVQKLYSLYEMPSVYWIMQRLLHPIFFAIGKKTYYWASLGKCIIQLGRSLHLWPPVLTDAEKKAQQPQGYLLPNILCEWAVNQLNILEQNNTYRKEIAHLYETQLTTMTNTHGCKLHAYNLEDLPIFLRYIIRTPQAAIYKKELAAQGILLGDWYRHVIDPAGSAKEKLFYTPGSCPEAEKAAQEVLNLPTNPTTTLVEVQRVIDTLRTISL